MLKLSLQMFRGKQGLMNQTERAFIRHPSEIPLEYRVNETPPVYNMNTVNNVSKGGLSFQSDTYIEPQQWLHIFIPVDEHYFEADAQVRWCRPCANDDTHKTYDIGVSFCDDQQAFSARMVEQVCHIEKYKQKALKEGRSLTSDQAAAEWIEKYADSFPAVIH
jgi:hypothetical protein